jgi:hypothetical protein
MKLTGSVCDVAGPWVKMTQSRMTTAQAPRSRPAIIADQLRGDSTVGTFPRGGNAAIIRDRGKCCASVAKKLNASSPRRKLSSDRANACVRGSRPDKQLVIKAVQMALTLREQTERSPRRCGVTGLRWCRAEEDGLPRPLTLLASRQRSKLPFYIAQTRAARGKCREYSPSWGRVLIARTA